MAEYIYDPTDVQAYFHECSDDYIVLGDRVVLVSPIASWLRL